MSKSDTRDHCCTDPPEHQRSQPAGQTRLHTRPGTWATFRQRMIAGLTTQSVTPEGETGPTRPLQALTTRQSDDGTIALLDAWATACDVLAFYDERILEEGYLGTAKERRSLVEIANALGYVPSPGVAASVRLAFEIQDTPITDGAIALDPGIAVMSVPPEGELPQTYETVEGIEAFAHYNGIPARQTRPHVVENGVDEVWLAGLGTRLEPGHRIVIAHPSRRTQWWKPNHRARVTEVEVDQDGQRTWIRFAPAVSGFSTSTTQPIVLAFRQRVGLFGHNAPEFATVGDTTRIGALIAGGLSQTAAETRPLTWGWPNFTVGAPGVEPDEGGVHLEREVDGLGIDSWVCLEDHNSYSLGKVQSVGVRGRSAWTLSARVTTVTYDNPRWSFVWDRRGTTVHFASEELPLSGAPDDSSISGLSFDLDTEVPPMEVGRAVIVEGETLSGETYVLETAVAQWTGGATPRVTLRDAIDTPLRRSTVRLLGNVALATHGKTVLETVIGNGDVTATGQRFSLRQGPLTWVSTNTGAEAELELRIDGVLWKRVDSLYHAGGGDRVYVVETAEDGSAEVVLGDGVRGARAPTGVDNVTATIRVGLGLAGELDRGRLTLLQTRPQGLFAVRNPAAARGGADPESMDDVRTQAPLHVMTLDRLVSLQDYEDYARAYPGIGKARATELWDGRRAFVHVTVAAASGEALATTDPLLGKLRDAIDLAGDPTHVVQADGHLEVRFDVHARLRVDLAYERPDVEARVKEALVKTYAFERRAFGQPVAMSEVAAVIHRVEGVVAVDVDSVHAMGTSPAPERAVLRAALPQWSGTGSTSKAELLLVREAGIQLSEMTA
jgi:hypothetical protein